ncbi:hypothetical protein HY416_01740, partial [Candidatus Kaiserbacteria bacterium]|nr:hypothetical protein [Candidatus Kaiserbacteria bacterium]
MSKINSENSGKIIVKGARTHNLKNITVEMPRNKLIAITGLSGSGKSSLAFDTIFAEGQRRYVESLSAYARQFLRQMQKPDVDEIQGLSPAISIDQKSASGNPRSTVATITEIYDYLRVLYARVGKAHCLICGREIRKLSNEEIIELVFDKVAKVDTGKSAKHVLDPVPEQARYGAGSSENLGGSKNKKQKSVFGIPYDDAKVRIYAPVVLGRKGEYYQLLYDLLGKGYAQVRVDGAVKNLRERIDLEKNKRHAIDALVDEFFLTELKENATGSRERLAEAVERAINESDGLVRIEIGGVGASSAQGSGVATEDLISARFVCPYDGFSYPEIEPRLFSFNSPYGACQTCNGLGTRHFFGDEPCPDCAGARLRKEALHVLIGEHDGGDGKNIVQVTALSIEEAMQFFNGLKLSKTEQEIAKVVLREIKDRLSFMLDVGIEYLTLDRRATTLSGGESQRIRLASQLGSKLVGALYVLDEPTIGLHPRDNDKLLVTLRELRDIGNTVLVVEHDEDTIYSADYLVDVGPGAGIHGGEIVAAGDME